ncbi:hypothetical protein [Trichococcus collinsii]|uniref:Uncharacterized protein n=1 Tax=Trichococcus collinsii TaxID=157076 RepID=A0AB37ZXU1_9LACT|nr:hypothetical protein [Trichococcus collinsii]CZR03694.1 Hypothetical protein Tcol_2189 [Trichococcus collinsii]SEA01014.1 hypothetical protein SAMN04488525_101858 [Trichococcus collinsii]
MKSLTVRTCVNFSITENLPLIKAGQPVGNIAPTGRSFDLGGRIYNVYTCNYYVTINDTIMIEDRIEGGFTTVEHYKKSTSFEAYYSANDQLLFVEAPTAIAKTFLSLLQSQYREKVNTIVYDFDFGKIGEYKNNAKAIFFAVNDDSIDNKVFWGNGVDQDTEAIAAIDNSQATYLLVEMDIIQRARTIGFSKKGAVVIYNVPNDLNLENPYLQLAYNAIQLVSI